MGSAAMLLPDIERRRLRALAEGDTDTAAPLHADEYQLITPNGSELTKDDYLGDVRSGRLPYRVFEPITDIAVLGDASLAVLRYRARISFDEGPGFTVWHTDCYRLRDDRWQVVWSQPPGCRSDRAGHRKLFGQIIVRHIWATGEPSKPSPSLGWRKFRPTRSSNSSKSTATAFGSKE
jgi:Domain of unknown function (DUF4440)